MHFYALQSEQVQNIQTAYSINWKPYSSFVQFLCLNVIKRCNVVEIHITSISPLRNEVSKRDAAPHLVLRSSHLLARLVKQKSSLRI